MSTTGRWLVGWLFVALPLVIWGAAIMWPAVRQLADLHRPRSYFIPSASMEPTLAVDDVIRPRLVEETPLRRGMIVVVQGRDSARIDRIAGLGGDVVSMRRGRLWLNGRKVVGRQLGAGPIMEDGARATEWLEQLPGESGSHRILDAGSSVGDDFGPTPIPPGSLFLLGDNRDRAADSRFPPELGGVGIVREKAVLGIADRLLWGHGRGDLGRPLDGARP